VRIVTNDEALFAAHARRRRGAGGWEIAEPQSVEELLPRSSGRAT
jgi:hypothetical protein